MARAVVSARLSLGPRSIPQAARREASKSAGDWPGTTGAGNLWIDLSIRAIRDLSLWFTAVPPQAATSIARHAKPGSVLDAPVRGDELDLNDHGLARRHHPSLQSFQPLRTGNHPLDSCGQPLHAVEHGRGGRRRQSARGDGDRAWNIGAFPVSAQGSCRFPGRARSQLRYS
jgi:hypothetical protein